MKNIAVKPH